MGSVEEERSLLEKGLTQSGVVPAFWRDSNYAAVVIEAYDSLKYLILPVLKVNTEEHSIMTYRKIALIC